MSKDVHDKYVFQKSSVDIFYLVCDSVEEFYKYYSDKKPQSRTYNEVVNNKFGPRKFILDIDGRITDGEMEYVIRSIKRILYKLTKHKPNILVYDISTSHHIVVGNMCFDASGCGMLANIISERISKRYPKVSDLIDLGVYKEIQMFRIEGSTKYTQRRWKYLFGSKELSSLDNFKQGLLSYTDNCYYIDSDRVVDLALELDVYQLGDIQNKLDTKKKIVSIPDGFAIRKTMDNLIILDRICPSYCKICRRVHDSDGAYIAYGKFYCRRNN